MGYRVGRVGCEPFWRVETLTSSDAIRERLGRDDRQVIHPSSVVMISLGSVSHSQSRVHSTRKGSL